MVNGEPGRRTWGPRIVAPLAFFAAATALVLVVHTALNSETKGSTTTPSETRAGTGKAGGGGGGSAAKGKKSRRQTKRFYRIKGGDTLEAIARRFDTTVDDLLTLNPGIDANSLSPGQRIRVR